MIDRRRKAYLSAMGIELWEARAPQQPPPVPADEVAAAVEQAVVPPPGMQESPPYTEAPPWESGVSAPMDPEPAPADMGWDALQQAVSNCRACGLCETRTRTVFGVGDQQARLMIIGEAPGADEDRQGEPFVGRAGQLLTAMLAAIGLQRDQVYIANVLKCRPPGNRDPHADEVAACRAYLDRQIALIQPDLILSVGGVSAKNLLQTDDPVGRLRGRVHHYSATGTPLRVTYHPAYLLRRPEEKAKTWKDLQQVWTDLHAEVAR